MDTKHTPGPWEWIGDNLEAGRNDVLRVGDDGKEYGLHSAMLFEDDDPVRAQANRDLIAAAPDLLAALVALDECYCEAGNELIKADRHQHRLVLIDVRRAIAKAIGAA